MASSPLINQLGHKVGARGARTRRALLDALRRLMDLRPIAEIRPADVAAEADLPPTNFYTYFKTVGEAALVLCEDVTADFNGLASHIDSDWSAERAFGAARALILDVMAVWDRHAPVLRFEHIMAERGDPGFAESRVRRLRRLHLAIERRIAQAQSQGYHPQGLSPRLASYETVSLMESVASGFDLLRRADGDEAILDTTAHIIVRLVTGR